MCQQVLRLLKEFPNLAPVVAVTKVRHNLCVACCLRVRGGSCFQQQHAAWCFGENAGDEVVVYYRCGAESCDIWEVCADGDVLVSSVVQSCGFGYSSVFVKPLFFWCLRSSTAVLKYVLLVK